MNLFISNSYIDTVGSRANVQQLIRIIAEDNEIVHSEIMNTLLDFFSLLSVSSVIEEIEEGHDQLALFEGDLYANGEALSHIFDDLYPDDYTQVIDNIINALATATDGVLKLDHNGLPVQAEAPDFSSLAELEVTPKTYEPFPEKAEVLQSGVVALEDLGELTFNGILIPTLRPANKTGIVFDVITLYRAIYNLEHEPEYLYQLLVENNHVLKPEDVHVEGHRVYLTENALTVVHGRLCHLSEWSPMVAQVVMHFSDYSADNAAFDLLGNLEG